MSLIEKIEYALESKESIKGVLQNLGVACGPDAPFGQHASLVEETVEVNSGAREPSSPEFVFADPFVLDEDCPSLENLSAEFTEWFNSLDFPTTQDGTAFIAIYKDLPADCREVDGIEIDSESNTPIGFPLINGAYRGDNAYPYPSTSQHCDLFYYYKFSGDSQTYYVSKPGIARDKSIQLKGYHHEEAGGKFKYAFIASNATFKNSNISENYERLYWGYLKHLDPSPCYYCYEGSLLPKDMPGGIIQWKQQKQGASVIAEVTNIKNYPFVESAGYLSSTPPSTARGLFSDCFSLEGIPPLDTSNITDFYRMFFGCASLKYTPPLDLSSGTTFENMFAACESLQEVGGLRNTDQCTNFYGMFDGCSSLKKVADIHTSNGTDFRYMFRDCASLKEIPSLDISKATQYGDIFMGCISLESINLYNSSNNSTIKNYKRLFTGNDGTMSSVPVPTTGDILPSLKEVTILNVEGSTDFSKLFENCQALKYVKITGTGDVTNFDDMFCGCSSLETLYPMDTSAGESYMGMFDRCKSLRHLDTSLIQTESGDYVEPWVFNGFKVRQYTEQNVAFGSCPLDVDSIKYVVNKLVPYSNPEDPDDKAFLEISIYTKDLLSREPSTNASYSNMFEQLVAEANAKGWDMDKPWRQN